jgi:hypothetical protein
MGIKMTVDVDLSDDVDDSDTLEEGLKKSIISSVLFAIEKKMSGKIDEEIVRCVKSTVETVLLKKISGEVARLIELGEIKTPYSNDRISIVDYIRGQFEENSGWKNADEKIKCIATAWGKELLNRYDRLFAIHLVEQMRKNGLLKEDCIAGLLKIEDIKKGD